MYEQYLNIDSVPSYAVLKRIMEKKQITQKELSHKSDVITQRINDILKGKRKFTVEISLCIERALGIDIEGFFYQIQCKHEIYKYRQLEKAKQRPDMNQFSAALFWDTNMEFMDWDKYKSWVIQRIFEYGDEAAIKEAITFYGQSTIETVLSSIRDTRKQDIRDKNLKKYIYGL